MYFFADIVIYFTYDQINPETGSCEEADPIHAKTLTESQISRSGLARDNTREEGTRPTKGGRDLHIRDRPSAKAGPSQSAGSATRGPHQEGYITWH